MKLFTVTTIFLAVLNVASCAPKINNLSLYQKQFITKTSHLPSKEQLAGKSPKIAVFKFEESDDTAKQSALGKSVANNIENILTNNKLAKLVDRRASKKLKKEIQLSELNKTGSYKGPQVADYAISGAISSASFTKKYSSGSSFFNPKTGTYTHIPPSFKYKAEIAGNLKIYDLPSMQVHDNIDFHGYTSRSENVQQDGGFRLGGLSIGGTQAKGTDRDDGLIRKAGEDGISSIELELKHILSARGYILEKRVKGDDTIFKVTLGSLNGIKHGDKVKIIGQYDTTNPITNEVEIESRVVSQAIISEIIQPKISWIIVKDRKMAQKIRLGDVVKLNYKRSGLSSLLKQSRKYLN